MPFLLITLCWVAFAAVWLVLWFNNKETRELESWSNRAAYMALFIVAAVLLWRNFNQAVYPFSIVLLRYSPTKSWVGFVIVLLGLLLALVARIALGRNWSGSVQIKEGHELVTKGPYAFVRHPIYSAILLMVIGTALVLGNLGALLSIPFAFAGCWIKLRQEERFMAREFPETYSAYAARTKRLIPYVL